MVYLCPEIIAFFSYAGEVFSAGVQIPSNAGQFGTERAKLALPGNDDRLQDRKMSVSDALRRRVKIQRRIATAFEHCRQAFLQCST